MNGTKQKIHFIAVGGSIMHNLAIALSEEGHHITGSDDHLFDPSKSRLEAAGILPKQEGWDEENITPELDTVIVGMHAKADNPELLRAQELGLEIVSFPEYIYKRCEDKQRVVIAGSHGKTTITSMVMHVLNYHNRLFDYAVGAQIQGFKNMVSLTEEAPIVIIEGDEYLTSPLDTRPKFAHYHHHMGVISGIAWDHINVYPTFDVYAKTFEDFAMMTPKAGTLIFNEEDNMVASYAVKNEGDIVKLPYKAHKHVIKDGKTFLVHNKKEIAIELFGEHNMFNLSAAYWVCHRLTITDDEFYEAIASFKGAGNRLETLAKNADTSVFKDFAHAPSKLKATSEAVKKQFPDRTLVGCIELHTFSSLNKKFLDQYKGAFAAADVPVVFFNPEALAQKKLEMLSETEIKEAFDQPNLKVFSDVDKLQSFLLGRSWKNSNLLLMSSGNFGNMDLNALSTSVLN